MLVRSTSPGGSYPSASCPSSSKEGRGSNRRRRAGPILRNTKLIHQIDLAVATEIAKLILEIKGYIRLSKDKSIAASGRQSTPVSRLPTHILRFSPPTHHSRTPCAARSRRRLRTRCFGVCLQHPGRLATVAVRPLCHDRRIRRVGTVAVDPRSLSVGNAGSGIPISSVRTLARAIFNRLRRPRFDVVTPARLAHAERSALFPDLSGMENPVTVIAMPLAVMPIPSPGDHAVTDVCVGVGD